jgi:WhiB family redox-sensing transcriptional regulator
MPLDSRFHCRNYDPERWFPVGTGPMAQLDTDFAKSVCGLCPSQANCLTWALENAIPFGIWGGMTEEERRAMIRRGRVWRTRNALHPTDPDAVARQLSPA